MTSKRRKKDNRSLRLIASLEAIVKYIERYGSDAHFAVLKVHEIAKNALFIDKLEDKT